MAKKKGSRGGKKQKQADCPTPEKVNKIEEI